MLQWVVLTLVLAIAYLLYQQFGDFPKMVYGNQGLLDEVGQAVGGVESRVESVGGDVLKQLYPPMTATGRPLNAWGAVPTMALTPNDLLPKDTSGLAGFDQANVSPGNTVDVVNFTSPSTRLGLLMSSGKKGRLNQQIRSDPIILKDSTVSPWHGSDDPQRGLYDREFDIGSSGPGQF